MEKGNWRGGKWLWTSEAEIEKTVADRKLGKPKQRDTLEELQKQTMHEIQMIEEKKKQSQLYSYEDVGGHLHRKEHSITPQRGSSAKSRRELASGQNQTMNARKIFGLSIKEANVICGVDSVLLNDPNSTQLTSKILFTS